MKYKDRDCLHVTGEHFPILIQAQERGDPEHPHMQPRMRGPWRLLLGVVGLPPTIHKPPALSHKRPNSGILGRLRLRFSPGAHVWRVQVWELEVRVWGVRMWEPKVHVWGMQM